MLISHEVPLSILELSKNFNDYDYALVHLFKDYPEYEKFYRKSSDDGRIVILDNSAYELSGSVGLDILIEGIKKVNPSHVIAPDYIEDIDKTLCSTYNFLASIEKEKLEKKVDLIGVIQGRSYEEYIECYNFYKSIKEIQYIAIPFDIRCFFDNYKDVPYKSLKYAHSRNELLERLVKDGIIDYSRRHHLLGVSDPVELYKYNKGEYRFLTSIDSSCPIILAMFNLTLPLSGLGCEKRSEKLADNLIYKFKRHDILQRNVNNFRHYLNREDCVEL